MAAPRRAKAATPPPPTVDVEAVHQSIADLESLASHPGWKIVGDIAQRDYGLRPFAATVSSFCKLPSAQSIGEQTLAVVSAREAVVRIMGLPTQLITELRQQLHRVADAERAALEPSFPPEAEHSS